MGPYERVLEEIPGLTFMFSADGTTEFVSQRLLDYLGRPLEEIRAWAFNDTMHPDDFDRITRQWRANTAAGQTYVMEHRLRRADGVYRWVQLNVAPRRDESGHLVGWCGILFDIDEARRSGGIASGSSRAAQLAGARELAASIAHELNQPLAALVANAHACREWLCATPPVIDRAISTADRIVRNGNAAAEVVARIRSLFCQTPPVKELLNMNDVVHDVCDALQDDIRHKRVTLRLDLQNELPGVSADRVQIQQLLTNLARNAIEAMDGVQAWPRELGFQTTALHDEVLMRVHDHGIGLIHPHAIFEPFYTTKPNGLGMGLSISRSIVDAHGGRLWATPNEPCGTTFHFTLPLT